MTDQSEQTLNFDQISHRDSLFLSHQRPVAKYSYNSLPVRTQKPEELWIFSIFKPDHSFCATFSPTQGLLSLILSSHLYFGYDCRQAFLSIILRSTFWCICDQICIVDCHTHLLHVSFAI